SLKGRKRVRVCLTELAHTFFEVRAEDLTGCTFYCAPRIRVELLERGKQRGPERGGVGGIRTVTSACAEEDQRTVRLRQTSVHWSWAQCPRILRHCSENRSVVGERENAVMLRDSTARSRITRRR